MSAPDEAAALAALDADAIARDLSALVQAASPTGDERPAVERVAELAAGLGLASDVVEHDLAAVRALPEHPGEEAPRAELLGAVVRLGGDPARPRLCVNGHVDVVGPGAETWRRPPFGGEIAGGVVHGRGAADMKGGVIAALHALGAIRRSLGAAPGEVVLHGVSSEEDGGLGTVAALAADDRFDACLIPEPTGFRLVCAQAGALTFAGEVRGRSAHAALRLEGVSALDRYVPLHLALAAYERHVNADVAHPLMRALPLPYPLLVGRVEAGAWSSQVPDLLRFEGRVGVPVGSDPATVRAELERVLRDADDGAGPPPTLRFTGGQFAPAETAAEHPFVRLVAAAAGAELGAPPPLAGVPYGADMRLFCARGIPCVMLGTPGIELAHAVDERVAVADVVTLARVLVRLVLRFGTA